MIDFEKIRSMTPAEVKLVAVMDTMLKHAEEIVDMIKSAYTFKMGEDSIKVADDGNNKEFLTHSGVWQARYLHQKYDVEIDAEKIMQMQLAAYAVKNGICPETCNGVATQEGELALIDRYFSAFVRTTREKLENAELKSQLDSEFK